MCGDLLEFATIFIETLLFIMPYIHSLSAAELSCNSQKKVIVGMSGGVDSSVSAYILLQQGYQVEGLFMKNWEEDDNDEYCAAAEDLKDAQAVADKLGIELHQINFAAEYWDNVFEYFLEEYKSGRTPNPDIMCNKEIKFKAFLEFAAEELKADYIATGHYVRRREVDGHWQMLRGMDDNKDQSYFLYTLGEQHVGQTLFPIGDIEKPQVREIAQEQGLITHDKKDSTGICFIGERKFTDFLSQYLPAQPGVIETPGQGADHPRLFSKGLVANQLHWVDRVGPTCAIKCSVKTRYRQEDIPCSLTLDSDGSARVIFDQPQKAVTPGQSAVFYLNEVCLGGGIIESYIR